MFREDDQIRKRLSTYFEREITGDSNVSDGSHLFVGTEFLISKYDVTDSIKILATSRKLILSDGSSFFTINYNIITGIYCEVPFKSDNNFHILNIITIDGFFLKVSFNSVTPLVQARNEIFKIINTVIKNWQGANFKIDDLQNKQLKIVNIPPLPD